MYVADVTSIEELNSLLAEAKAFLEDHPGSEQAAWDVEDIEAWDVEDIEGRIAELALAAKLSTISAL